MELNDIINSIFQFLVSFFILINCIKLFKDKKIYGVSFSTLIFLVIFSIWNLYYFFSLNQKISFYAGLFCFMMNLTYLILGIYYKNNNLNG